MGMILLIELHQGSFMVGYYHAVGPAWDDDDNNGARVVSETHDDDCDRDRAKKPGKFY